MATVQTDLDQISKQPIREQKLYFQAKNIFTTKKKT